MPSISLCVLLAFFTAVSAKVTINGKDETVSIKYKYLGNGDDSITPTRTEKDIQDCLTNNGTALKTSVSCKKMQYTFGNVAPCLNGASSTKDPGSPKAMSCSAGQKNQTCYQTASSTFTNAFTTKPTSINWQCSGKDEFCCGYECCKPRSTKWIWIIVLLLVLFFIGIPCIALCVCCCFCGLFAKCMSMVCKKGSSPSPQTNQVQDYKIEPVDNYRFNSQYNAPPRAIYTLAQIFLVNLKILSIRGKTWTKDTLVTETSKEEQEALPLPFLSIAIIILQGMTTKMRVFLALALISFVSCTVRSRSGGRSGGSGGGGGTGWGSVNQLYMNNSATPTRNETTIQSCLQDAMKTGAPLATSITCQQVSYSFAATSPCTNPVYSAIDRTTPQAMVCGANTTDSVCYQTTSETFIAAFAFVTNIIKPYAVTWKCTGAGQFCCGFECCTMEKEKGNWIWIVILVVVFLVILPTIAIGIYCVVKKNKAARNGNASGQTNDMGNYGMRNTYNNPPRAY